MSKEREYYEHHYGFLGRTLDEMLSHDDAEAATVYDAIFTRLDLKPDYASFNDTERKYREVWLLVGEVGNGGFYQYFNNGPYDGPTFALAGLKDMGAVEAADIFERVLAVFPDCRPPEDRDELQEMTEQLDEDSLSLWDECSEAFCSLTTAEHEKSIWILAVEYVKRHRIEFNLPDFDS